MVNQMRRLFYLAQSHKSMFVEKNYQANMQSSCRYVCLFFSKEQLTRSNCTQAEGRELLPQDVIDGIRCKSRNHFVETCLHFFCVDAV